MQIIRDRPLHNSKADVTELFVPPQICNCFCGHVLCRGSGRKAPNDPDSSDCTEHHTETSAVRLAACNWFGRNDGRNASPGWCTLLNSGRKKHVPAGTFQAQLPNCKNFES